MTNLQKYEKVFADTFNLPVERFDGGFTYSEIAEWDSISHMSLVVGLEEEFGVMLDSKDILHFGSFENGKLILSKHGVIIE